MGVSTERLVDTNGVRLRVIEAGERGAPVVVLAHGFPELAYSWRHQIPVLADAGYHVLAPDQRGYGGSSCPGAIEAYNIHELTADLVGLLDGYNVSSGYHLNINVLNRETLEDAMEHPENYPQLTIRVSGYAVNFVRLTRDQQLDVLSRTFHGGL